MDEQIRRKMGPLLREARLVKNMTLLQFYGGIVDHVNNFSAIENGSRMIGKRLAKDIINYHRINFKWLENRELPVFLLEKNGSDQQIPERVSERILKDEVPFYNVHLSEIYLEGNELFREDPEFYVNFRPFNDCSAYLPVYGDSMYPKFSNGEVIAVKEVRNVEIILWGEPYLVITNAEANHLAVIRLLFEHKDREKLILRAANPDFSGDVILNKSDILKLFLVKGKITRSQL